MGFLVFEAKAHHALWGTESWEISAFPPDASRVPLDILFPGFPLLFKVIDAKSRLSVQVHPNEKTCRRTGGNPKTEMWCALSDGPIYAGLKPGTRAEDVEAAVRSGDFEELLVRHEARFGDVFFIPGGLVHSTGDGVKLYEVQQSSDTTFRLYDWGRVDADGRARALHIEKGLQAIDYTLPVPVACKSLDAPFFKFSQKRVLGSEVLLARPDEFLALYTAKGAVVLDGKRVPEGTSVLVSRGSACEMSGENALVFQTRFAMKSST